MLGALPLAALSCLLTPSLAPPRARPACMLARARKKGPPPRGFGAPKQGASGPTGAPLDDTEYAELRQWLRGRGARLGKVAIADFDGLRGVIAVEQLEKGDEIISIPAEAAVDLGTQVDAPVFLTALSAPGMFPRLRSRVRRDHLMHTQGDDVIPAALTLLNERDDDAADGSRSSYWETLPPITSDDLCTPDFFSEKELQMLQWPPLTVDVRNRNAAIRAALGAKAPTRDTPPDELPVAAGRMRELRWAVWLVHSRVLTVRGPEGLGHKLLIPFIDMFNHRRVSSRCQTYPGRTGNRPSAHCAPGRRGTIPREPDMFDHEMFHHGHVSSRPCFVTTCFVTTMFDHGHV